MTVWPPQLMVSVSPAAAPVPARPTTTGVPFEASPALMPPPPFSGIDGDRRRRRRRRVDGHRLTVGVGIDIAHGVDDPHLVGEARAVRRGIGIAPGAGRAGGDIGPVGAAVAADLHRLAGAERAVRARHRQRRVVGDIVARRRAAVGGNRRDRNRRRRRRRVDRHRGRRRVGADIARCVGQPGRHVERALALRRDRRRQAPSPSRCCPRCRPPGACR